MPEDKQDFISRIHRASAEVKQDTERLRRNLQEHLAHLPKQLDRTRDAKAFSEASGKRDKSGMYNAEIVEWDDGYGNRLYLRPSVGPDQIQVISARIVEQRSAFDALGIDEQTRIRKAFGSSKGVPGNTQPYRDLLQSESLGRRFEELKANPQRPLSPK